MDKKRILMYSGCIKWDKIGTESESAILRETISRTLLHLAWQIKNGQHDESLSKTFTLDLSMEHDKWDTQVKITLTPLTQKELSYENHTRI